MRRKSTILHSMIRVGLTEKVPFGVFLIQTQETGGKKVLK